MCLPLLLSFDSFVLQWGRDRAVAEFCWPIPAVVLSRLLQWGRDRAVAELPNRHQGRNRALHFNGAATARSRNCPDCPAVRPN